MKDQYFGDVNDFRKYGLLRNLLLPMQLKLGVCWMLTPGDGRSDGKFLSYLEHPQRFQHFDPPLFQWLKSVVVHANDRRVARIEASDLFPNAIFQSPYLIDNGSQRSQYFAECSMMFRQCDVVFFDPDNGVEISSVKKGGRNSAKFVFWDELFAAYSAGASVLVYQHFPRLERTKFIADLASQLGLKLGARSVFTFRTPHVVFLLAAQDRHVSGFRRELGTIEKVWRTDGSRTKPQIVPAECHIIEGIGQL